MNVAFADTSYWIALLLPGDQHHAAAQSAGVRAKTIVTTQLVLAELGAAFARAALRHLFLELIDHIQADTAIRVLSVDDALFESGVELFRQRLDKDWSLTDCVSFVVMEREKITDALSADRHFEQAGFVALLK